MRICGIFETNGTVGIFKISLLLLIRFGLWRRIRHHGDAQITLDSFVIIAFS